MGQTLIDAVLAASDLTLTGALEISGSKLLGRDVGERCGRATGVAITADAAAGVGDHVLTIQVCEEHRQAKADNSDTQGQHERRPPESIATRQPPIHICYHSSHAY